MERFIGRQGELDRLNKAYSENGFHMTVIYGRRRVGKSTLISEFIRGKRAIYFVATKVSAERNLELLSAEVVRTLAPTMGDVRFSTLEALFDFITNNLSNKKLIFVIDELPFWAEKDESILSVLQKYIDVDWPKKNLFIILCGSALSFMQDKVLSEKSPLFGRRTMQIRLDVFDYLDSSLFVPKYSPENKAISYGVTGGVAKYLSLLNDKKSLDDNIKSLFFDKSGYLYEEPRNLLTQEFSDITTVSSVIEQVALGQNTPRLISDKIHERESTVLYSLEKLMTVGIVEKRSCITEKKNKKKQSYVLKDQMFRFWYSFVPNAESAIALDYGGRYYDQVVKPRLHEFMGAVFEDMCRHFTLRLGLEGSLNCFITEAGSWWGMEEIHDDVGKPRREPADIDIVGLSSTERKMVIGECKFRNEKTDKGVLETLIRRGEAMRGECMVSDYLLFSLGGYTKWYDSAFDRNVRLFKINDLYEK